MAFSLRKKKISKEKFIAYFKTKPQSKDEIDGIPITLVTENATSVEPAYAEEEMQKTYERPKICQVEFLRKLRKKLTCMQEILLLLHQLTSSLLNIQNIFLSEPQLTPGRRSAMMVTGPLSRELENPTC